MKKQILGAFALVTFSMLSTVGCAADQGEESENEEAVAQSEDALFGINGRCNVVLAARLQSRYEGDSSPAQLAYYANLGKMTERRCRLTAEKVVDSWGGDDFVKVLNNPVHSFPGAAVPCAEARRRLKYIQPDGTLELQVRAVWEGNAYSSTVQSAGTIKCQ